MVAGNLLAQVTSWWLAPGDEGEQLFALSGPGVAPRSGFICPVMSLGSCPFYKHTGKATRLRYATGDSLVVLLALVDLKLTA